MSIVFTADLNASTDKVKEVMTARGYEYVSEILSEKEKITLNFVKYFDKIRLHASVQMKSENVILSFVELKMACNILCGGFAFNNPRFEEFEQQVVQYSIACLNLEGSAVSQEVSPPQVQEPPKLPKKPVEERSAAFKAKIKEVQKEMKYPPDDMKDFYGYWTEMNEAGKKMRFELETVFDIKRRIATWMRNKKDWNIAKQKDIDEKIKKQNAAIKVVKTVNPTELF